MMGFGSKYVPYF